MVAVVDVQRDVAVAGERILLAAEPLPAPVGRGVDVAVREHDDRERTLASGDVHDSRDALAAASVGDRVPRVLRAACEFAPNRQVTAVERLGHEGRQGHLVPVEGGQCRRGRRQGGSEDRDEEG